MPYLKLPKEKDQLAEVLRRMIKTAEAERNLRRIGWTVAHMYMQGARQFSGINYQAGTVKIRWESVKGELNYRYENILRKFQTELGRLLRIDTGPHVKREGNFSLDGLRNASMAQASLNILTMDARLESLKLPLLQTVLKFGTAGLACWGQPVARLGRYQPVCEVVPPWELLPIPANPASSAHVQGIMRVRFLPYDWLKDQENLKLPEKKNLQVVDVPYGTSPEKVDGSSALAGGSSGAESGWANRQTADAGSGGTRAIMGDKSKEATRPFVKTAETFIPEPDGTLARYIVWAGGKVVLDESYEQEKEPPLMPIGVARYFDVGGFWGRAFVDPLLPTNVEVEFLLRRLFENAQDMDEFGFLMIPFDAGVDMNAMKKTGRRKVVQYQPDLTAPEHKPYSIRPYNTGDFPGKVAAFGRDILREEAGHSEMLSGDAPGRVDSAQALGFLQETSSIPLSPVAVSLMECYGTVFKAMLGMARDHWDEETLPALTMLDDSLVGVVLDPATGRIKLDENAIPHPTKVDITIKAAMPRSLQQRKMELLDLHERQIITARDVRRISFLEGLDMPIGDRAEIANYRKAVLNNIILFGNGKEPGQIIISSAADNPEIHLEVLNSFIARPEFTLASRTVRQAFEARQDAYQKMLGTLPAGMGQMEEEAETAEAQGGPLGQILAGGEPEAGEPG